LAELAHVGFDPVFGARPLKRAIQSAIENPLAKESSKDDSLQGCDSRYFDGRQDPLRKRKTSVQAVGAI